MYILIKAHILIIAVILLLKLFRIVKNGYAEILLMMLIPFFGLSMLRFRKNGRITKDIENDKFKADIDITKDMIEPVPIIPINDALILDDTKTKRSMIKDMLYEDPADYISQLALAKKDKDTEIIHYAATALTEIQKDYDIKMQGRDREAVLENYINSGLLKENNINKYLLEYQDILKQKIKNGDNTWDTLNKKTETDIRLKDVSEAETDMELLNAWPDNEETYILRLHFAALKKNRKSIDNILKEIKEKNIYLSAVSRNIVDWFERKTV